MTISLHRITAGSGYGYLTRQVAAMDSTEKGHTGLASYYTERGEVPGSGVGSGRFSSSVPFSDGCRLQQAARTRSSGIGGHTS